MSENCLVIKYIQTQRDVQGEKKLNEVYKKHV